MAARTGMANLITRLRNMADAGTAEYVLDATTYWSDDHLEDILDQYTIEVHREKLAEEYTYDAGGTARYHDFYSMFGNLEEDTSGTTRWLITASDGSHIGTADYTGNYINGHIRFTGDQAGSSRYLTSWSYSLPLAAADIWRHRASSLAHFVTARMDDQTLSQGEWFDHCMKLANHFAGQAGIQQSEVRRNDING